MRQPRCLDLFCGAGGAAKGLQRAGFYVVGVDNKPQPRYCGDEFIQADAMTVDLRGYDFIWASPPCQRFTTLRTAWNHKAHHPDLIGPIRERLQRHRTPYVIENVVGAPLIYPIRLCGTAFNLGVVVYDGWRELRRHRLFECSTPVVGADCRHQGATIGIYGDHARDRRRKPGVRDRGVDFPDVDKLALGRAAMDMQWCDWRGLSQGIPLAYSEFIGRQVLAHLEGRSPQGDGPV